jgi:hypothetical protein
VAYKDPKAALAAQGLPEFPVGTLDELKAANLPPSMFPSCAEPQADGTVVGCPYWNECTMSYKGKPSEDGGGPRNHCWERIKSAEAGGGVVRNTQPCFYGVSQMENSIGNGESLSVIADEGEEFEYLTYVLSPTPSDLTNREQKMVKATVVPFKRLANNEKTAAQVLRASIMQKEKERVGRENKATLLGVEAGVTPLDKRGPGSLRGGKKES